MSIAKIRQRLFALPARGVFRRGRAGVLRGMFLALSGFLFGGFAVTDTRTARHGDLLLWDLSRDDRETSSSRAARRPAGRRAPRTGASRPEQSAAHARPADERTPAGSSRIGR